MNTRTLSGHLMKRAALAALALTLTACASSAPPDDVASTPDAMEQGCEVMVGDTCYADRDAACEAAGCPDTCTILRTDPAKVECPR